MNFCIKKYIILTSIVELILAIIGIFVFPQIPVILFFTPLLFAAVGIFTIFMLNKPKYEKIIKFSSAFMLVNMIKLITFIAFFIIVYINLQQEKKLIFTVAFMAIYFVYAIMDTIELLKINKKQ